MLSRTAVALGASVVEKGVCPDDPTSDQDVAHALPVGRFGETREKCERIHAALGDGHRHLARDREPPAARMGLVARRDLGPGETVSVDTVDFAWPAVGVPVEQWSVVRGWSLRGAVERGSPVHWRDLVAP